MHPSGALVSPPSQSQPPVVKGIVFNLFEEVVSHAHGEAAWDELLERTGIEGAYTSLGNYPDDEFYRLVEAASGAFAMAPREVVRWFGREAQARLAGRYPEFFREHDDTRSFVLTLNDIIHPEVRKLYPGADVPDFDFDTSDPEVLRMRYTSHRKMCAFAEGLIEGAARVYGEVARIRQPQCMHRGDDYCLLEITFEPTA